LAKLVVLKDGRRVSVRPLEMSDKDAVVDFYAGLSPEVLRWALPPYDRVRVERFFGSPEQLIGVVGVADGKVVGHLHIFRFVSRMSHVGELIIYIHQNFLNVGLGSAMMREGIRVAKARRLRRIQLSVIEGNEEAVRLYEKLGFQLEGMRYESYLGEDGRYYASIDMGLIIE
jgi:RimJ/RimL family protein N-acetyltransferase